MMTDPRYYDERKGNTPLLDKVMKKARLAVSLIALLAVGACGKSAEDSGQSAHEAGLEKATLDGGSPIGASPANGLANGECGDATVRARIVKGCVAYEAYRWNGNLDWGAWYKAQDSAPVCGRLDVRATAKELGESVSSDRSAALSIGLENACAKVADLKLRGGEVYNADGARPSLFGNVSSNSGKGAIDTSALTLIDKIRQDDIRVSEIYYDPATLLQHYGYTSIEKVSVLRYEDSGQATFERKRKYIRCDSRDSIEQIRRRDGVEGVFSCREGTPRTPNSSLYAGSDLSRSHRVADSFCSPSDNTCREKVDQVKLGCFYPDVFEGSEYKYCMKFGMSLGD